MKHLQPYQEFINESDSPHKELTRQEFNQLAIQNIGSRELYRWDPLNRGEEESLVSLYNYLDTNGEGRCTTEAVPGEDLRFRIILKKEPDPVMSGYPRIQIGKISPTLWTVDTSDEIPDDLYLVNSYNTFPSLEGAIGFVADKYGPAIGWTEIK